MTEDLGIENKLMVDVVEENINKTTAENNENIIANRPKSSMQRIYIQ